MTRKWYAQAFRPGHKIFDEDAKIHGAQSLGRTRIREQSLKILKTQITVFRAYKDECRVLRAYMNMGYSLSSRWAVLCRTHSPLSCEQGFRDPVHQAPRST